MLAACSPRPGGTPADLLLISVDTLRADRLGCYGYGAARTPHLDALAADGVVFTQATTPIPRTTPALASLLTGLEPRRHGSREVGQPMTGGTSLASRLAAHGWTALAVSASRAASPAQDLDQGFERFVDTGDRATLAAEEATRRALGLVAGAAADRPLFLWVHYVDPHAPYDPPSPWGDDPAAEPCRALERRVRGEGWQAGHVFADRDGAASAALAGCSRLYDAEIAYADHWIGRLLEGFAAHRGARPAWVVVTADHGENLGEDGLYYQHGPSLHDASLRVPLIVRGPGVAARRDRRPARLEDVAPTLLARLGLAGGDGPGGAMDGVDLSPRLGRLGRWSRAGVAAVPVESGSALMVHNVRYLRSGRRGGLACLNVRHLSLCGDGGGSRGLYDHRRDPELRHDLSAELPRQRAALERAWERWPVEEARRRAVRTATHKLVEIPLPGGGWQRVLYDLRDDPAESVDRRNERPEVAEELGALLDRWTRDLPGPVADERSGDELEALRALGYVG